MRIIAIALLFVLGAAESSQASTLRVRPRPVFGTPQPGRNTDVAGPSIQFESGPAAQADMDAVTNATLNWYTLGGCVGSGGRVICQTNQTLNILGGPDALSVTITTPDNIGNVSQAGLQTYQYINLSFSQPVAAVGMNITDGYRFGWVIGLEAFDVNGVSLGKVEENGFDQIQPPTIFNAAIANSDIIKSVRIYTPDTGAGCPGCLLAGTIQIHEAPEPATLISMAAALVMIGFGLARKKRGNPA